jgi:FMN phosphatase YigB (HAD superfamily)
MIKALLFDWHGVLDKTTFSNIIKQLSLVSNISEEEIRDILRNKKEEFIVGKLQPNVFWNYVSIQLNLSQKSLKPIIKYSLTIDLDDTLWIALPKLAKKYELAILSDCPPDKTDKIRSTINLSLFKFVGFSSDERKSKLITTQANLFKKVNNTLEVLPEHILYIDDTEKHLISAEKYRFKTHLFSNTKRLLKQLSTN